MSAPKGVGRLRTVLWLGLMLSCGTALQPARSSAQVPQEPVLERYSITAGAENAVGVRTALVDPFFGSGSAKSRVLFSGPPAVDGAAAPSPDATASLSLRVWRRVPPDTITFALLVFRVEVLAYDAERRRMYSRLLRGFTFGDSASGDWQRTLHDIPATAHRVDVTFFGNYE